MLTWSPSATDTSLVGVGRLEVRVTDGEVVGKSVRILTIVEESLVDGIVDPPDPPAQEWLNQVLTALAALDVNDIFALLNLNYALSPSLKSIQSILRSGQDKLPEEEKANSSASQYGFTRGAGYYDGRDD